MRKTYRSGRDVRKIGSNTGGVDNIVESQLINMRASLQKQRQRLGNGRKVSNRWVGMGKGWSVR